MADDLYDDFLEKFSAKMKEAEPADPTSDDAEIGPLSSTTATERLQDQLDRAVKQGAEVVVGGERKDNFFPTTVLTGITEDNDAYREEFFGPVASVYKVGSEEEAIELANDTPYGLGSYVFTDDSEQATRVANSLDTGMVFVDVHDPVEGEDHPAGDERGCEQPGHPAQDPASGALAGHRGHQPRPGGRRRRPSRRR